MVKVSNVSFWTLKQSFFHLRRVPCAPQAFILQLFGTGTSSRRFYSPASPRPAVLLSACICVLGVMREITTEQLEPHSFILAPSSNNRPLIASPFLRRERESEHEAKRERKRKKNTAREMAGGHGSSSVTITLLQRDLLIQHKIDTWIWFHPVDPYKALVALRALLPSLVAYLPMNFDSKPSYKSMSAFQWRKNRGGGETRAGRLCSRR